MGNLKSEIAMKRNNTRKIEEMYYHKKVKFPKVSDIHNYREKLNERRILDLQFPQINPQESTKNLTSGNLVAQYGR